MVFIVRDSEKLARLDPSIKVLKAEHFVAFRDAQELVADAQTQHETIIASAQAAYEAERRRGYADGLAEAKREQAGSMIEIVCHTVEYFSRVESRMVDLVLDSVRKIVGDFDDRTRVVAVVRGALSLVRTEKHLLLRVHPDQVEAVRVKLTDLLSVFPAIEFIDVCGDAGLAQDACAIESDIGIVEANIPNQIDIMRKSFENALEERA
jgi:type III secretion protein L